MLWLFQVLFRLSMTTYASGQFHADTLQDYVTVLDPGTETETAVLPCKLVRDDTSYTERVDLRWYKDVPNDPQSPEQAVYLYHATYDRYLGFGDPRFTRNSDNPEEEYYLRISNASATDQARYCCDLNVNSDPRSVKCLDLHYKYLDMDQFTFKCVEDSDATTDIPVPAMVTAEIIDFYPAEDLNTRKFEIISTNTAILASTTTFTERDNGRYNASLTYTVTDPGAYGLFASLSYEWGNYDEKYIECTYIPGPTTEPTVTTVETTVTTGDVTTGDVTTGGGTAGDGTTGDGTNETTRDEPITTTLGNKTVPVKQKRWYDYIGNILVVVIGAVVFVAFIILGIWCGLKYRRNRKKEKDPGGETDAQPEVKDAQPEDKDVQPVDEDVQPVDENVQPADEDVQPVDEDVQPVDEDVQPADKDVQPADKDVQPVDEDVQPADENVQPADEDVQPVDEDVQPVDENVQPADEDVQPADEDVQPADEDLQPADKDGQSKDKDGQSKDKDGQPEVKDVQLADEDVQPVDDDVQPVDKNVQPADEDVQPADEDGQSKDKDGQSKDKDGQSKDKDGQSKD